MTTASCLGCNRRTYRPDRYCHVCSRTRNKKRNYVGQKRGGEHGNAPDALVTQRGGLLPGSAEKILLLTERADRGEPLFRGDPQPELDLDVSLRCLGIRSGVATATISVRG